MRLYFVALALSAPVFAQAQERPFSGTMQNTKEWSSIDFDCSKDTSGLLNCQMIQASVRKQSASNELREELSGALTQFKTDKPMKAEECAQFEQIVGWMRNPQTAPKTDAAKDVAGMAPKAREDAVKMLSALIDHCRAPTEQTVTKLVTAGFDQKTRTCLVSTHRFSIKFKPVESSNVWTSNDGPNGPCGVITVAQMEPDPKYPTMWNYTQRKIITNPNATAYGTMKCSQLDQSEVNYSWLKKDVFAGCEYIKFSPI
jgi:hypothetical protein